MQFSVKVAIVRMLLQWSRHGRGRPAAGRGDVSLGSGVSFFIRHGSGHLDSVASRVPAAGRV